MCVCVCTTSKHEMETLSLCSLGNAQTPRHTPPATADVASATLFIITQNLIALYNLHNKFSSPPLSITVKQITQIRYASATHCLAIYCSVGLNQRSCSTLSPVSSGMGDCLWTGKLSHYVTSHPGQLSLPSVQNQYTVQVI